MTDGDNLSISGYGLPPDKRLPAPNLFPECSSLGPGRCGFPLLWRLLSHVPSHSPPRGWGLFMDILDYTHDVPRESLARRAINYSPTICFAFFLVVYPFFGGYLWTDLCISYLGVWGWGPTLAVVSVTIVAVFALWIRSVPKARHQKYAHDLLDLNGTSDD